MNSEPSVPKCPQCGVAIPADAPQGLCPRCVLLGAATATDAGKPVPRTEPPSPDALRAAFPQLEIVELIGRGGMGFVYKARQAKLDRLVALKLLPLELGADPHFAERFHREARALARLNHPGIVAVYDFGVSAGFGYLLMEFVDGVNLRQAMQAGRFTQREALALVPKICEAIQFAHEQGVLHRDIKPENILLDTLGRVKIADFGIAKLVGEDAPDLTLTLSGARLGTPSYMAPEQVEHPGTVDHRADIYSLGVVFYELLTGELPLGRFAPPSAKADLDARVDDIVMRALAKERELRQQSAGEVKTEVETVARESAPNARPGLASLRVTSAKQWMRTADGEYRSHRTLWGWPLLHIAFGRDPATGRPRVARGIVAIGERAVGGLAIGGLARGIVAFGGLALGLVSVGGLSVGALAFGGLAAGLVSFGGMSLGLLLALGGIGIGWNAGGGLAIGQTVAGGLGLGTTVWDSRMQHPDARWLLNLLQSGGLRLLFFAVMIVGTLLPAGATVWARTVLHNRPNGDAPRSCAPPWMRRLAIWFFALGGVALLPTLLSLGTQQRIWHSGSLLLLTGWALWSTSRIVRRIALAANWLGVASGAVGFMGLGWYAHNGELPGAQVGVAGLTANPLAAVMVGLLQLAAFVAGLMALHHRKARAAFGTPSSTGWRRWLGRTGTAAFLVAAVGLQLLVWKKAVRSARQQNPAVARLREIPAGGDRAWLALNPPADLPLRFTVTVWSNGVAHPVATNEQAFATYSRPVQVQLTRAIRPGEDGAHWELSDHSELVAEGEETWLPSGIPRSVALQAVNTRATVQLSAGDRLRRWLFLPPFEASQLNATANLPQPPAWGVSMDLEIVQDTAATAKADVLIGLARERLSDVRARLEVGAVSPLEVAAAEHDLAVLQAGTNTLAIAKANLKFATQALEVAHAKFAVGKLTSLELHEAMNTHRAAELDLTAAEDSAGTDEAQGPSLKVPMAQIRLTLAREQLAELRRKAEVGVVAPRGQEVLAAELTLAVAEAELKGDALAAAKARLNHAEQVLAIVQRRFDAGRATPEELSAAKLAVAEATDEVAKLERGP